jgi:hypothetical protein
VRAVGQAMRWIPSVQEDGRGCDPNCSLAGPLDKFYNIDISSILLRLLDISPEITRTG